MDIRNAMTSELSALEIKLAKTKTEYENTIFPEGDLVVNKNGNYYKYFNIADGERKLIPSSNKELIQKLALKKYYERQIYAYQREISAIKKYLKTMPNKTEDDLFKSTPVYKELMKPMVGNLLDITEWEAEEYVKSKDYPENLILNTIKGDKVRSKSEAIIADELFRLKVPYRYECRLMVGNTFLHPDFTAINKRTGEIYIWEHFGRVDDSGYLNRNCIGKMIKYLNAGYYPTINMITTYETIKDPFTSIQAKEMIEQYLL
ncbi:MAG: hypothetical protein K6F75_09520 [Butyrivibrio sp.]|nr:hypothetical protein [Butyrivibrio sp.]